MSTTSPSNVIPGSLAGARQRRLQRLLESYGPLTHDRLCEFAHADGWAVDFDTVLARAVRSGRVRRLGDALYEAGRPAGEPDPSTAA